MVVSEILEEAHMFLKRRRAGSFEQFTLRHIPVGLKTTAKIHSARHFTQFTRSRQRKVLRFSPTLVFPLHPRSRRGKRYLFSRIRCTISWARDWARCIKRGLIEIFSSVGIISAAST